MTHAGLRPVLLICALAVSCASADGRSPTRGDGEGGGEGEVAARPVAIAAPTEPRADEVSAPTGPSAADGANAPVVPAAAFPTVEALCAAQKALIVPQLAEAEAALAEREEGMALAPSCERAPEALAGVALSLGAPFFEVVAIRIETGYASEVRLAVRTDDGWRAAPRALLVASHDDPGCSSIVRDERIHEVRVERSGGAAALVVIDEASRGDGEEYDDEGLLVVEWNMELRRSGACRLEGAALLCDEPVVVRVTRTPSVLGKRTARPSVRFATEAHVDARGRVVTRETYDDAELFDEPHAAFPGATELAPPPHP